MCLTRITNAILDNENCILTVSNYDNNDLFISRPAIINKDGIRESIYVKLNKEETDKLTDSINIIKKLSRKLKITVNEMAVFL